MGAQTTPASGMARLVTRLVVALAVSACAAVPGGPGRTRPEEPPPAPTGSALDSPLQPGLGSGLHPAAGNRHHSGEISSPQPGALGRIPMDLLREGYGVNRAQISVGMRRRHKRTPSRPPGRHGHGHRHRGHRRHGHKHGGHGHRGRGHRRHGHGDHRHRGYPYHPARHGHSYHGPGHYGPGHYDPGHYGPGHYGPKRHGVNYFGPGRYRQIPGNRRVRRSLNHIWKKIKKAGKDIKEELFSHHRRPLPGYVGDRSVPQWRDGAGREPPPARPHPGWPGRYPPRDGGAGFYPGWPTTTTAAPGSGPRWPGRYPPRDGGAGFYPGWPTTTTAAPGSGPRWPHGDDPWARRAAWPRWPAVSNTTHTTPAETTTTTTTATSRTTPATTTTTTTTAGVGLGGGVLVITTQPVMAGCRAGCRAGFSYHEPSRLCHERCPSGASFRPASTCYCDQPSMAVDFILWQCALRGGAGK